MTTKFERFRLSSMKYGIDRFSTNKGVNIVMDDGGAASLRAVGKDSAGRQKVVELEMTHDDVVRLYHTLGHALNLRGKFMELETEHEESAERERRNNSLAGAAGRFIRLQKSGGA